MFNPMPMEEFMDFIGYRNMLVNEKVEECLAAARRGEESISLECDGLTDSEIEQLRKEVERRIRSGNY